MPFEMSREFTLFFCEIGIGDFCSWKLNIPDTHPSQVSCRMLFFDWVVHKANACFASKADIVSSATYVR